MISCRLFVRDDGMVTWCDVLMFPDYQKPKPNDANMVYCTTTENHDLNLYLHTEISDVYTVIHSL